MNICHCTLPHFKGPGVCKDCPNNTDANGFKKPNPKDFSFDPEQYNIFVNLEGTEDK